jgi:bilin biosynthesis protein
MNSNANIQHDQPLFTHAEADELMERVTEQITLHEFNPNDHQLLQQLVEGMGDTRGMVRLRFAETLGQIGEPATPVLLEALLKHPNPVVRRASAKTLTLIADPTAVPSLIHALLNDEDTVVKGSSAGALARTGEAAVPPLLEIIADAEQPESTKGHAAWALSFIGAEAAEYLFPALQSESVDVRCAAISALGKVAQEQTSEEACDALISALTDSAPLIRSDAAAALAQIQYPPAIPHLIQALQDPDGDVRKVVVSALGKTGDRSALKPLQSALNDPLEVVRVLAKVALAQLERQLADWS